MKTTIALFFLLFSQISSATKSNISEDIRSILNLEDHNQIIFSISQIQKGKIIPSSFESHIKFQLKIELIHYNNILETEDTFIKTDRSLEANNDQLGLSAGMILFSQNNPLELVPVHGVVRIKANDLNTLLTTVPNPYYADLKISLIKVGLFTDEEIANITFDMSYLRHYLDTVLRKNQTLEWNLKNDKTKTKALLNIRLVNTKY
ncbi:MAG: hypothetical protein KBD76_03915 [Bacteriovorax sp.]|jgi:hypothetical protein|nr:hypothetical protein [Bacteriovorax sp.]